MVKPLNPCYFMLFLRVTPRGSRVMPLTVGVSNPVFTLQVDTGAVAAPDVSATPADTNGFSTGAYIAAWNSPLNRDDVT